jgi:hypothetical protein
MLRSAAMYVSGRCLAATEQKLCSKLSANTGVAEVSDMESGTTKAKKYRERADQIRRIAEDVRGECDHKYLLDVAKDYERMAKDAKR